MLLVRVFHPKQWHTVPDGELCPTARGSSPIFSPDLKISGRSISLVRQKKRCTITQKPNFNQNPNAPPPRRIWAPTVPWWRLHLHSDSDSDLISTMKCSCQCITYPLGSMLTRVFYVNLFFRRKIASSTQKIRINDDGNYIIYAGNVFCQRPPPPLLLASFISLTVTNPAE